MSDGSNHDRALLLMARLADATGHALCRALLGRSVRMWLSSPTSDWDVYTSAASWDIAWIGPRDGFAYGIRTGERAWKALRRDIERATKEKEHRENG